SNRPFGSSCGLASADDMVSPPGCDGLHTVSPAGRPVTTVQPLPRPLPEAGRGERAPARSPPSLLGKGAGGLGSSLHTLRRFISAGAPVPASVIERFARLLPESAEVFTPYGATEALPVANIGSREILT